MVEAQKWVHCLRENNTTVIAACSSYVECAKTIADFPPTGDIKRVYSIANSEFCDLVHYTQEGFNELNCRANNLCQVWTPPTNVGLPALQQGIRFADATTDSTIGRARAGTWAYWRHRLYVFPWLQSNESLIVEWDGWKQEWFDTDIIDTDVWGPDAEAFVKLFVKDAHMRDFDCDLMKRKDIRDEKAEKLADLIYWCRERTSVQKPEECAETRFPRKAELDDDVKPSTEPMVFAVIADYGWQDEPPAQVASLVRGWNPQFIVTAGDNWYGSSVTVESIDRHVGQFYHDFIYPYSGVHDYGAGAAEKKLYAAVGNHDRDPVGRLAILKQFLSLPADYYDFVKGHVHFFMLDSGFDNSQVNQQANGNTSDSVQGQWLKTKAALSVAKWKVALLHHQPYSSVIASSDQGELTAGGFLEYPSLRWPFKAWGLNVMFNGHSHNYERLVDDKGFTYLCAGSGGAPLKELSDEPVGNPGGANPFSVVRDDTDYGAIRCEVTCDYFKVEFFRVDGVLIDEVTFT